MEKVYDGKIIQVYEKKVQNQTYEILNWKDAVIVFPITSDGKILFIKEFRGADQVSKWKPVTGFIEPEYTIEENVQKEMREEIGFRANKLTLIHALKLSGTIRSNKYYYLAEELVEDKIENPDGDVIEEIKAFSLEELIRLSLEGKMKINIDSLGIFILYLKDLFKIGL